MEDEYRRGEEDFCFVNLGESMTEYREVFMENKYMFQQLWRDSDSDCIVFKRTMNLHTKIYINTGSLTQSNLEMGSILSEAPETNLVMRRLDRLVIGLND